MSEVKGLPMKNPFEKYIQQIPFCSGCSSIRILSESGTFEVVHGGRRSILLLSADRGMTSECALPSVPNVKLPFASGIVDDGICYRLYDCPEGYSILPDTNIYQDNIIGKVFDNLFSCLELLHDSNVEIAVRHDYQKMLSDLLERYEAQPVRFTEDFQIFRFMQRRVISFSSAQQVPVISNISKHNVLVAVDGEALLLSDSNELALGHRYYDVASLACMIEYRDIFVSGNICTCSDDMMDMYWFVLYSHIQLLLDTVDTCDESAINVVQRRLTEICNGFQKHHFRF